MASVVKHDFQYESPSHQAETAVAGMWLFLATEVLFFGGLILCWIYARHWRPAGFDAGGQETELWIGTVNTVLLITSSFSYALGLAFIRVGNTRRLIQCCMLTLILGLAFLGLKFGLEWRDDFAHHLFPAAQNFKITGANAGGARLFFVFYFISTGLHGLHMIVGVGLLTWIMLRARRGEFSRLYHTPVHAVGLYWSFVDIVWLTLYPLIYLIGEKLMAAQPEKTPRPEIGRLLLTWAALLILGGAEFAASFLPLVRPLRPLVMIPGVLMVVVVAVSFMEVHKGLTIVRGFAVAAMFWLFVLLALGSLDPLTRTNYYVPHAQVK